MNKPLSTSSDESFRVTDMDWGQVVLNGGPPCFFVENRRFCGRAERWAGHGDPACHDFVSLRALLESQYPLCAVHRDLDSRDALELTIAENGCVACSLNEREALIDILDKAIPSEIRADSVTELQKYVNAFDSLQRSNRELREALAAVTRELDEVVDVTKRSLRQHQDNFEIRIPSCVAAINSARAALKGSDEKGK